MKSGTNLGFGLDAFVLFSLLIQITLAVVSPWRKHNVFFVVWVVLGGYLLESGVAYYAMGLIPNNDFQGGRTGDLRVFWAPYLILHLGGPSTLTALSLSDNELWIRFAARLFSLSYTFGRVFLHSFPKHHDLWLPTAIIFCAAFLRYIEKVICRFLARLTKFHDSIMPDPDPGVNYAKLIHTHTLFKEAGVPAEFHKCKSPSVAYQVELSGSSKIRLTQVQIVKEAYRIFHEFRGLFVNSVFSYEKRDESRRFFLSLEAEDAFEICEVELNFAYDVFYTKSIFFDKPVLCWLTIASFCLQVVSTSLWARIDKASFHRSSVHVTNALVYGTISVDLFTICMLATSDWAIAWVNHPKVTFLFEKLLLLKKCCRQLQRTLWKCICFGSIRVFFRWSEIVPQLNLIAISADSRSMIPVVNVSRNLNQTYKYKWFTAELRNIIFSELVIRSIHAKHPEDLDELCSSRGLWVLSLLSRKHHGLDLAKTFKPWITDVGYEESLIVWNIATTLCYYTLDEGEGDHHHRKCSMTLADYMLHLLIRPFTSILMPTSAAILGYKIYIDTCADARRFFNRKLSPQRKKAVKERHKKACENIMQVNTDVIPPKKVRGQRSKSVLFDGCLLAKELQRLNNETEINMWELIGKVWAEMLFFSAAQSRGSLHLQKLHLGGELLTLVWMLMAHLGLPKKYFRYKNHTSAELVIGQHATTDPSLT